MDLDDWIGECEVRTVLISIILEATIPKDVSDQEVLESVSDSIPSPSSFPPFLVVKAVVLRGEDGEDRALELNEDEDERGVPQFLLPTEPSKGSH